MKVKWILLILLAFFLVNCGSDDEVAQKAADIGSGNENFTIEDENGDDEDNGDDGDGEDGDDEDDGDDDDEEDKAIAAACQDAAQVQEMVLDAEINANSSIHCIDDGVIGVEGGLEVLIDRVRDSDLEKDIEDAIDIADDLELGLCSIEFEGLQVVEMDEKDSALRCDDDPVVSVKVQFVQVLDSDEDDDEDADDEDDA